MERVSGIASVSSSARLGYTPSITDRLAGYWFSRQGTEGARRIALGEVLARTQRPANRHHDNRITKNKRTTYGTG